MPKSAPDNGQKRPVTVTVTSSIFPMEGSSPAGSDQMILVARIKSTDRGSRADRQTSISLSRAVGAEVFNAHFADSPLPSELQRSQPAKINPADSSLP
jgi:hypothetical protein